MKTSHRGTAADPQEVIIDRGREEEQQDHDQEKGGRNMEGEGFRIW